MYGDECTSSQLRASYARIPVEVDVTKDLPKCIIVGDISGNEFEHKIFF